MGGRREQKTCSDWWQQAAPESSESIGRLQLMTSSHELQVRDAS